MTRWPRSRRRDSRRSSSGLLIHSSSGRETIAGPLAALYRPALPPEQVRDPAGYCGAEDAFTADPRTIGFDRSARRLRPGGPTCQVARPTDGAWHEFSHILQKAWLAAAPVAASPLNAALLDIWTEGVGNYFSSDRWIILTAS
jgi:hypothetical protein